MDFYLDEENCYQRLLHDWLHYGSLIIAVDFDDTIYDFHKLGRSYADVINLLKRWKPYAKIIIWTSHTEDEFPAIQEYCDSIGLEIDGINTDAIPNVKGRKMYANVYVDDHAGLPSTYRMLYRLIENIEKGFKK